jgi:Holliday junction DNA helicase RuvA
MISLITGVVRSINIDKTIVEVGGVGLTLSVTATTSSQLQLGTSVQLFTSLVVREDSLTLYGFLDDESRSAFELVQTVSGIGPKVALSIMGALTPQMLALAISQEDVKSIEKVPGIGRKGAQRLILELKGKLNDLGRGELPRIHQPVWREQLSSALISLGFSAKESDEAISYVVAQYAEQGVDPSSLELSEILKATLQSGRRG